MKSSFLFLCIAGLFIDGCTEKSEAPASVISPPQDTIVYVIRKQHEILWPSLAQTPWPKARHDAQCTGRSSYAGPTVGRLKYTIQLSTEITDPVVGADSVFYVVSDSSLYAVTLSGNQLWNAPLNSRNNLSPPMIDARGVIYVGSQNGIFAFYKDGSLYWHTLLDDAVFLKSCAFGLDGTLFITTRKGTLYAINNSGNILWQHQAPAGSFGWGVSANISFAPDGSCFYVGGTTAAQSLYTINLDGTIARTDSLGGAVTKAISVDVDGNLFLYAGQDLVSLTSSGNIRWRLSYVYDNWDVTIDPNGNIAYLSMGYLIVVDNLGQERWRVKLNSGDFSTHLVCDAQGTIFVETSSDNQNYDVQAISSEGKILWTVTVPAYVKSGGPSITREGYLLFPQSGYTPLPKQMYIIE